MQPKHFDRFELLLQMAMYFRQQWSAQGARSFSILNNERKCLAQLYRLISAGSEVDAEIEKYDSEFISNKALAEAALSYPYLHNLSSCQQELWRLYIHYEQASNEHLLSFTDLNDRKKMVLSLLIRSKFNHTDLVSARLTIEHAILHHLYLPIIAFESSAMCSNKDMPPF